jgi:phosphoglycolate phosphatase
LALTDRRHRYRLLAFDWDGTLADSTSIIASALQSACRDVGEPVPDDVAARYVIGLGLAQALAHVAPGLAQARHPEISARYRHHYLARDAQIPLFDGAASLLEELHAEGYMLAVATGKTRIGLDRSLAAHALRDRFHATRCADEGRPKPHPGADSVGVAYGAHDVEGLAAAGPLAIVHSITELRAWLAAHG